MITDHQGTIIANRKVNVVFMTEEFYEHVDSFTDMMREHANYKFLTMFEVGAVS